MAPTCLSPVLLKTTAGPFAINCLKFVGKQADPTSKGVCIPQGRFLNKFVVVIASGYCAIYTTHFIFGCHTCHPKNNVAILLPIFDSCNDYCENTLLR
jgi:hypothetical protein